MNLRSCQLNQVGRSIFMCKLLKAPEFVRKEKIKLAHFPWVTTSKYLTLTLRISEKQNICKWTSFADLPCVWISIFKLQRTVGEILISWNMHIFNGRSASNVVHIDLGKTGHSHAKILIFCYFFLFWTGNSSSASSKSDFKIGEPFEPSYVYRMLSMIQSSLSAKVRFRFTRNLFQYLL